MKRPILLAFVIVVIVGCAGSGTPQPPTWTPEAPKKIIITIELPKSANEPTSTATDEPTFTPIPPTFTLTATKISGRTVVPSGVVSGFGRETLVFRGDFPGSIKYNYRINKVYFILSNGQRVSTQQNVLLAEGISVVALEVVASDSWDIEFLTPDQTASTLDARAVIPTETKTKTLSPTRTVGPTRTLGPTRTAVPTRTQRPTQIPTVFLPSTDTPAPVAVQPTNPPAQACCKICSAGKACGDTCIAKNKTCHTMGGCACNG